MKKIGIFYGSSTGTTENIAKRIAEKLGVDTADVYDVANAKVTDVKPYDVLLLGSSTWGSGDLQDDWESYLGKLKKQDLTEKTVALFGCGDAASFGDTFCDALGTIYSEIMNTGCKFAGAVDSQEYTFESSTACINNMFVGLVLDELNEDDKTEGRIDSWLESLKKEVLE